MGQARRDGRRKDLRRLCEPCTGDLHKTEALRAAVLKALGIPEDSFVVLFDWTEQQLLNTLRTSSASGRDVRASGYTDQAMTISA
ncbi:MAG: hypothetical protein ACREAC_06205 [Blastocatellia bacterium]